MTPAFYSDKDISLTDFKASVERQIGASDVPLASRVEKNIPIYDVTGFAELDQPGLMNEWATVLNTGSGVLVLANAYTDTTPIDRATDIYLQIIADEKLKSGGGGDHFAKVGANDRIWNSLQKLAEAAPDLFVSYFANAAITAVSQAWLGPAYQMTAQVNLVRPGGAAQDAHRDYHLGFQTNEQAAAFPAHAHHLSPALTLQGGIAHCDMSIESGPTKLLPFSQTYGPGYLAYRDKEFRDYFEAHCVQLPLNKGDAVFFNPALFHAAGDNRSTDIDRMVNLLQISSAFGRAMESIDREKICNLCYPEFLAAKDNLDPASLAAAIGTMAEGYSFPTNLGNDPPVNGLAPKTQAQIMAEAVEAGDAPDTVKAALAALSNRQKA